LDRGEAGQSRGGGGACRGLSDLLDSAEVENYKLAVAHAEYIPV